MTQAAPHQRFREGADRYDDRSGEVQPQHAFLQERRLEARDRAARGEHAGHVQRQDHDQGEHDLAHREAPIAGDEHDAGGENDQRGAGTGDGHAEKEERHDERQRHAQRQPGHAGRHGAGGQQHAEDHHHGERRGEVEGGDGAEAHLAGPGQDVEDRAPMAQLRQRAGREHGARPALVLPDPVEPGDHGQDENQPDIGPHLAAGPDNGERHQASDRELDPRTQARQLDEQRRAGMQQVESRDDRDHEQQAHDVPRAAERLAPDRQSAEPERRRGDEGPIRQGVRQRARDPVLEVSLEGRRGDAPHDPQVNQGVPAENVGPRVLELPCGDTGPARYRLSAHLPPFRPTILAPATRLVISPPV